MLAMELGHLQIASEMIKKYEKRDPEEIIGSEICTNEIVGFLIDVYNPNDIGDSLLENGIQYTNVVKTYSISQDSVTVGDVISGTFEILPDSLQSRVCPYMHQIYDVPEIIINH